MADSPAFERACDELERLSDLDRLTARGTVGIALKEVGLEAKTVTAAQLRLVVDRVLADQLTSRGIDGAAALCAQIRLALDAVQDAAPGHSALEIFERLGRR
jgi:hypothetical protein